MSNLPGNISLPSTDQELEKLISYDQGNYPFTVEDILKKSAETAFLLSPEGNYISFKKRESDGKQNIYIKNVKTGESRLVAQEKENPMIFYNWANESHISYLADQGGNENYHLFLVNMDSLEEKDITPYPNVKVNYLDVLKHDDEHMIIEMNRDHPNIFEPYLLQVNTGNLQKLYTNEDAENPIVEYKFNTKHELKSFTKLVNGLDNHVYYDINGDGHLEFLLEFNWKERFDVLDFVDEENQPELIYAISNLESDTLELIIYDVKQKKQIKTLFADEEYNMEYFMRSQRGKKEALFCAYYHEKYRLIPLNDKMEAICKQANALFENEVYEFRDCTKDENKFLFVVYSDRKFGEYYVYDVESKQFTLLAKLKENLKESDLAEVRCISFQARDGLKLHGYLTLPKGASASNKVPLIVNPHGGPYGPRNIWGIDMEPQIFAGRGYAVLQVNYRGSGGYGKKLFYAGFKQIGRKMLDDLEDGAHYALSLGMIDASKLAIYGGSYGGLATLGSLVKTPDLYVCGIDYVGVSNLFTFRNSIPPYWKPYIKIMHEQWYDETNPEEAEIMKQVSPALNIDKIIKPLFVIQGANDPRVNIDESDQIVAGLRARGVDVPYMVKYNEGHGFYHEDNSIQAYKAMLGFFAMHLK